LLKQKKKVRQEMWNPTQKIFADSYKALRVVCEKWSLFSKERRKSYIKRKGNRVLLTGTRDVSGYDQKILVFISYIRQYGSDD
jgi:hypothetical protein